MKNAFSTIIMLALSVGAAPGLAAAGPGDGTDQPRLEILDSSSGACAVHGGLCVTAFAPTTVAAPSAPAAALGAHPAAGTVPQFSRIGSDAKGKAFDRDTPWTIEVNASLQKPALAGNALFVVYDAKNPKALATKEVTAMWQGPVHAGNRVKARMTLSPEDGFLPAHTYRIRIAQLVSGKEILLAEGDVRLQ